MIELLEMINLIERLPAEERDKISECEMKIWDLVEAYGEEGKLAAAVVALSVIEDEEEAKEIAKEEAANKQN